MTWISKILTVFIMIASVGFMAVVMANVLAGGPNWRARANELTEVAFDQANPQAPWTSKRRTTQEDMGGGPILPAAIVTVQKKLIQQESDEDKNLDQKIQALKSLIETNKVLNQTDLEALKARETQLAALYTQREADWKKVSSDITAKTESLTKITSLTNVRNEESIRYKHQIEELVIEKQEIEEEVRRLKDLLFQARVNLERAKTRQTLLAQDGVKITPATEEAAPAAESGGVIIEPAVPATEKPAAGDAKPAEPETEKKAEEKATEEKPAAEKSAEDKATEDKPATEKPTEEKPTEEKPTEEKPESSE